MEIIVFGVVAAVSFLSYSLWRRSRAEGLTDALVEERAARGLTAGEPSLAALRLGDIVSHLTTDYVVEGVVSLDDEGRITRLYRLADASQVRWLGVRPGVAEPLFLSEMPAFGVSLEASAPEQLSHGGAPYRLTTRASARVNQSGSGLPTTATATSTVTTAAAVAPLERAWLYEYAGIGARRILAIAGRGRTDAFEGESVPIAMLDILPGT